MSDQKPNLQVRCPIVLSDARWIEERWQWLEDTFGIPAVKAVQVILPNEKCFPDEYVADKPSAERMLDRIAGYMQLKDRDVELFVFSDAAKKESPVRGAINAAGLYWSEGGKQKVAIAESSLANPLALAATLAHELGHVKLLGEGVISAETDDHEPLTDLLTVWQGLGVITSNAVLQENSWSSGLGPIGAIPDKVTFRCRCMAMRSPVLRTREARIVRHGLSIFVPMFVRHFWTPSPIERQQEAVLAMKTHWTKV